MDNTFTDKADARLEQIAQRIGYAYDASNAREKILKLWRTFQNSIWRKELMWQSY